MKWVFSGVIILGLIGTAIFVVPQIARAPQGDNKALNHANATNNPPTEEREVAEENINSQMLVEQEAPQDNIPLSDALSRVTKKPFGIHITPQNSPVSPEKFSGYHTGTDFEILPGEENTSVPIRAICTGTVRIKQFVSGYGGVLIQECTLNEQEVTALYGHVALSSINVPVGSEIKQGDIIGSLGAGFSNETDGERKHLHLGIHKGSSINYRGYVSSEAELDSWLDAEEYL